MYVSYLFDEYPSTLPALLLRNINVATFSFKTYLYLFITLNVDVLSRNISVNGEEHKIYIFQQFSFS